jgi:hypothetical protein
MGEVISLFGHERARSFDPARKMLNNSQLQRTQEVQHILLLGWS